MSAPFSTRRALAVARKEWRELASNRTVLLSAALVPLVFTGLAVVSLAALVRLAPAVIPSASPPLRDLVERLVREMSTMFLVIPSAVPSLVAATSVVGEKQSRSLEALLATPLRTTELVAGKLVTATLLGVIPTVCAWATFVGAAHAIVDADLRDLLAPPPLVALVLLVGPNVAALSTALTLMVSSRAETVQSAQTASGLMVLPLVGLAVGQAMGAVTLTTPGVIVAAVALAGITVGAVQLCASLFERETVLTRWK